MTGQGGRAPAERKAPGLAQSKSFVRGWCVAQITGLEMNWRFEPPVAYSSYKAMTKAKDTRPEPRRRELLRRRAEARLKQSPRTASPTSVEDTQYLVQELRVHQVELEMQNEELRRVQLELENSRDRFALLYNSAPVGYLTLDTEGVIREANLTAARLLGLDRRALLEEKLSRFLAAESQDEFYLHRQRAFRVPGMHRCDLQMQRSDGEMFSGRLESIAEPAGPGQPAQCLAALSDVTRLLRAEALRQSEANYRALFELNPAPMWITDENTLEFLDVNEAALKLYGWPREAFLRMTAKDIRPPEDVPQFLRQMTQQGGSRAAFVGEWRHLRRDGSVFDVSITISCIPYAGRAARLVLVNDITDRKRVEASLQESEERYRQLVEDDMTGDFVASPAGKVLFCNPAFVKIYGYSSRRAAERGNVARFNPQDWARVVARLRVRGKVYQHQAWHKGVDGRQVYAIADLVGVYSEHKELIQVKGYVFDNTDRQFAAVLLKQLNATLERRVTERTAELAEAYERHRAITDNALVGILTLDERGLIETLNPAAAVIFGYSPDEILGRNVSRFMASPDQVQGEVFLAHYIQSGGQRFMGSGREVLGRRKDGHAIMLELTVGDFTHGGNRRYIAMVRDITQRKRLERELLEISERERQQLGHDLHDGLGQHLHGLAYLAELLEKDLQQGASPRAAEAGQLNKYLNEALAMTRNLARGLQPVDAVPQGLMLALRELAQRTREIYRMECRFECRSPVLIHRHSAANHLYRIAQEAVNNALKHGKPTRVRIRLKATPTRIILGVRDNGVGIRWRTRPGRGMGLNVMHYRASAINGSLLVQRHPEGGTDVVCSVRRQALLLQENHLK